MPNRKLEKDWLIYLRRILKDETLADSIRNEAAKLVEEAIDFNGEVTNWKQLFRGLQELHAKTNSNQSRRVSLQREEVKQTKVAVRKKTRFVDEQRLTKGRQLHAPDEAFRSSLNANMLELQNAVEDYKTRIRAEKESYKSEVLGLIDQLPIEYQGKNKLRANLEAALTEIEQNLSKLPNYSG